MRYLLSCVLLLTISESFSQQTSSGFSLDVLHFQNIEQSLIPLKNSGLGLRASYQLERREQRSLRSMQIDITAANPKSAVERQNKSLFGSLSADFTRKFKVKRSDFYLGYIALLSYRNGFYKAIDQSHLYWTNFLGGGLSSSYLKTIDQSSEILISLKLPLFGLGSRSPEHRLYKVDDPSLSNILTINHSNLRFHTLGTYFQPTVEVEYRRHFAVNLDFGFFLRHQYLSTTNNSGSSPYKEIQNGCGVKLILIH